MVEKSQSNNKSSSIEELVMKAKAIGTDIVPSGTTELEEKILAIFSATGKIFTAKQVHDIIGEKETKFYSDKLWYMAKAGKLLKLKTRGYYQISPDFKKEE